MKKEQKPIVETLTLELAVRKFIQKEDLMFIVTHTPDENWRVIPYSRKPSFLVQTDGWEKEDFD